MKLPILHVLWFVAAGLGGALPASGGVVCPAGPTVAGVDLTQGQGSMDWPQVKASGIAFAYVRVSDGMALDSAFDTNYTGIKEAGMLRGAVQFFEPAQDPIQQADLLIAKTGPLQPGDLPPALDVEITDNVSANNLAANVAAWASHVREGTGRTPVIYTVWSFWNNGAGGSTAVATNPLWVANWNVTCPNLPTAWTNWVFWQSSGNGSVPGISGPVDLDQFNGSIDALSALAGIVTLHINQSATNTAIVSWPWPAPDWRLETSTNLMPGSWSSAPETINHDGTNNFVIFNSPFSTRFYRLTK